jgi:acylphosphatase
VTNEARVRARAQLAIRGRVQGVYFRAGLKQVADTWRLTGWVKNAADGSVEALLEGPRPNVDAVIEWARAGPPSAFVESVEVRWDAPREDAPTKGFVIR